MEVTPAGVEEHRVRLHGNTTSTSSESWGGHAARIALRTLQGGDEEIAALDRLRAK